MFEPITQSSTALLQHATVVGGAGTVGAVLGYSAKHGTRALLTVLGVGLVLGALLDYTTPIMSIDWKLLWQTIASILRDQDVTKMLEQFQTAPTSLMLPLGGGAGITGFLIGFKRG